MFKVGDKVRCINDSDMETIKEGHIYEVINIIGDFIYLQGKPDNNYVHWRFELVQEDKLPHELIGLPKYFGVKKDESDPLWGKFYKWFESVFDFPDDLYFEYTYYGYTGPESHVRSYPANGWNNYYGRYEPNIVTLAERDRIVNKRDINDVREKAIENSYSQERQTKKLSKPIRSCEYNGSIYKEDTIDGVSIEDMKATRDNINSKLLTHRNLFNNPKK